MKNNFLVKDGIHTLIQRKILNSKNEKLHCINIQKVFSSDTNLEKALYNELELIGLKSNCSFRKKSIIKNKNSISFIGETIESVILRIFFDTISVGYANANNYEIIGQNKSYFYRPIQQCIGYFSTADKTIKHFELITLQPTIGDIKNLSKPNKKLVLGILSLEHPHAEGNHLPALKEMQDFIRVKKIYNANKKQAVLWCSYFNAAYSNTLDEVLSDSEIDAVLITSKNNEHMQLIEAAAKAGKDIFCDKPIVIKKNELKIAADIVAACKITFITTYPVRLHPAILQAKDILNSGKIGKLSAIMATNHGCMYTPNTPTWIKDSKQNGGGSIIDHTVHIADTIRFLTNQEFEEIETIATSSLQNIFAEDISVSQGNLTDGSIFQIDSSWSRKSNDPMWGDVTFRIVGEKGAIWLDLYNNNYIEIFTDEGIEKLYPNTLLHQHGLIFYEYIKEKEWGIKSNNANLLDGIRTMEIVFASYSSLEKAQKVKISKNKY